MAVAMETVAWRGGETTTKSHPHHGPTWGADAQKLMHMMMGQLHSSPEPPLELSTLDLFRRQETQLESLELEPELPVPSGWEKCLDLQSGKLYYVQKASGVSTFADPRKQIVASPHEFLGSKKSETLRQENRSSSSSSSLDLFQACKRKWEPLDHHAVSLCEEENDEVELDLNLAAGGSSPSPRPNARSQTVCTMEMVQNALRRTENQASTSPSVGVKRLTVSSSFSSLAVSTRNDPIDSCSPSTSSSSSTSSRSRRKAPQSSTSTEPVCESYSVGLVMGACTRCLMYVMLKKMDPRCPRCEGEVPVGFSDSPCKRPRLAA